MTTALIFAGGTGKRMNTKSKPKQFLEMQGKPIIIYTLEHFEFCDQVDQIVIVCLEDKILELERLLRRYEINKVVSIVPGGDSGHASIYNGILSMETYSKKGDIVLLHDGVRPLIHQTLILDCIETIKEKGNAITVEVMKESVARSLDGNMIDMIPERQELYAIKAPQGFYYENISELYKRAEQEKIIFWDAASMCNYYGINLNMVKSSRNNIKITEPADYYIYRALYEVQEEQQILGL